VRALLNYCAHIAKLQRSYFKLLYPLNRRGKRGGASTVIERLIQITKCP